MRSTQPFRDRICPNPITSGKSYELFFGFRQRVLGLVERPHNSPRGTYGPDQRFVRRIFAVLSQTKNQRHTTILGITILRAH